MIAYKFLDAGGVAPFTGFRWPVGEWVEAHCVERCHEGIHACRVRDLPMWMGRELWEIELEGEVIEQERKVVARPGRLARRAPRARVAKQRERTEGEEQDREQTGGDQRCAGCLADQLELHSDLSGHDEDAHR